MPSKGGNESVSPLLHAVGVWVRVHILFLLCIRSAIIHFAFQ